MVVGTRAAAELVVVFGGREVSSGARVLTNERNDQASSAHYQQPCDSNDKNVQRKAFEHIQHSPQRRDGPEPLRSTRALVARTTSTDFPSFSTMALQLLLTLPSTLEREVSVPPSNPTNPQLDKERNVSG